MYTSPTTAVHPSPLPSLSLSIHIATHELYAFFLPQRNYQQRVDAAIADYTAHLRRLETSTTALFGQLVADTVVIVLDLSDSMRARLADLRKVIGTLIRGQLQGRCRIALLAYGTTVTAWRDGPECVEADAVAVEEALTWLADLNTLGSTNTLAALQAAMAYDGVQAVYLVSDGRPDQAEADVLAYVTEQHAARGVLVNTLSFSCTDLAANAHLGALAEASGGTFQYYAANVTHVFLEPGAAEHLGPQPMGGLRIVESLRAEVREAKRCLRRFIQLYHECQAVRGGGDVDAARADSGLGSDYGMVLPPPPLLKRRSVRGGTQSALRESAAATGTTKVAGSNPDSASSVTTSPAAGATAAIRRRQVPVGQLPPWDSSPATAAARRQLPAESSDSNTDSEDANENENETVSDNGSNARCSVEETASGTGKTTATASRAPARHRRWQRVALPTDPAPAVHSTQWLRTYSVRALRLTLLDVLKPTAVPHRAAFEPALGKTVHARALADVFAYYELEAGGQVWFVNPGAARLDLYLQDTAQLLTLYRARLAALVSPLMTTDERVALRGLAASVRAGRIEAAATEAAASEAPADDGTPGNVGLMLREIVLLEDYRTRAESLQSEVQTARTMGDSTRKGVARMGKAAQERRSTPTAARRAAAAEKSTKGRTSPAARTPRTASTTKASSSQQKAAEPSLGGRRGQQPSSSSAYSNAAISSQRVTAAPVRRSSASSAAGRTPGSTVKRAARPATRARTARPATSGSGKKRQTRRDSVSNDDAAPLRRIRVDGPLSAAQLEGGQYREGTPVLAASFSVRLELPDGQKNKCTRIQRLNAPACVCLHLC